MKPMSDSFPNLDFEDLVQELKQFERDARALQSRIDRLMTDARHVGGNETGVPVMAEAGDGIIS